jgi:hypothetical protein
MKEFERAPEKKRSLLEPTKREVIDELNERNWNLRLEGREPSAEQRMEFAHALREVLLDHLMDLETLRKRRKDAKPEAFETLRFMIQSGLLKGKSREDASIFLTMDDELRDTALTEIAFLRETDQEISMLEEEAGFSDEERAARKRVRKQHLATYEAEWGVQ